MHYLHIYSRRILSFWLLSVLTVSLLLGWAESSKPVRAEVAAVPPKMQVRAGFEGYYKQVSWLPVQVSLNLPEGNPNFDGWVEASFTNFAENTPRYRRSVQLVPPANRTFWVYLPTDNRSLQEIQVRLTNQVGTELDSQNIGIRALSQNELLMGVISDDSSALSYLNGQQLTQPYNRGSALLGSPRYSRTPNNSSFSSSNKPTIRVARISPADLPTEASGWDSLDGLVLSDMSNFNLGDQTLNQDSLTQAAASWLAQGRLLWVAGDSGLRKSGFLADLLPVKVAGPPQNGSFPPELAVLAKTSSPAGNFLVADSSLVPGGSAPVTQNGKPLLAKRDFGLGTSWFIATELKSFTATNGLPIWRYALSDYEPRLAYSDSFRQPSDSYRRWFNEVNPNVKVATLPDTGVIALFLLGYVVLIGPVIYLGLRQSGRRELGWLIAPAIAIIISLSIYFIGMFTAGDPLVISRLSVITTGETASGKMAGGSVGVATIYSNNRVDFRLNTDDQTVSYPFNRNRNNNTFRNSQPDTPDEELLSVQQGPGGGYGKLLMGLTDQRSFMTENSSKTGVGEGIIIQLKANGDELEGTLENRTGLDWVDLGIWKPNGKAYNIPLLKAGEKITLGSNNLLRQSNGLVRTLTGIDTLSFNNFGANPNQNRESYQEQKAAVLSTLLGMDGEALPKNSNRVYLVAWRQTTDNFPLKIENTSATTSDLTLLFQPVTLR